MLFGIVPFSYLELASNMNPELFQNAAVLLNGNARKVTKAVRKQAELIVPKAQLYVSDSMEEARRAVQEIVDNEYSMVVCGGGDGTIVNAINQVKTYLDEKNKLVKDSVSQFKAPTFAMLKLGTGNAWSEYMGARKGIAPLEWIRSGKEYVTRRFSLVEDEKTAFHFAGLGWDAAVLNDYCAAKEKWGTTPLAHRWMVGVQGYLTSMFLKTIPAELRRKSQPMVRVINEGDEIYRKVGGKITEKLPFGPGDTIYEGPVNVLGAGSMPYYGYKIKAFPYALDKSGFMNIRLIRAGVFEALMNMHKVWRGSWVSPNLFDFLATKVRVEFDQEMPYHVGGDAAGYRDKVEFGVSDFQVDVVDFATAR
jgi:diacylglycerol kinase family enzyme